jgi:hypothetical protein
MLLSIILIHCRTDLSLWDKENFGFKKSLNRPPRAECPMKQNLSFRIVLATSLLVIISSGAIAITATTALAQVQHFTAKLSGSNEVPPLSSKASGIATFDLNAAGTQMKYTLNVTDIDHVIAAHIHMGKSTENGPIVVNLFIPAKATGKVTGSLARSSINSTSLIGPLQGKQMPDLINIMKNGQAYVNVHTTQNPPGEVRGTITSK